MAEEQAWQKQQDREHREMMEADMRLRRHEAQKLQELIAQMEIEREKKEEVLRDLKDQGCVCVWWQRGGDVGVSCVCLQAP
jgi:hypothetical protein